MKVQDLLSAVNERKENNVPETTMLSWLSFIEARIYQEYVRNHVGADKVAHGPYTTDDGDRVLMIPDAYTDTYIYYLFAMIDEMTRDEVGYNNNMLKYNNAVTTFANAYNRANMPLQPSDIHMG